MQRMSSNLPSTSSTIKCNDIKKRSIKQGSPEVSNKAHLIKEKNDGNLMMTVSVENIICIMHSKLKY